jgi:hypothetical protein
MIGSALRNGLIPVAPGRSLYGVTRLLLAILLAISMAGTSGPAFAGPGTDCPMAHMSGGMSDHGKMGCCPPECAVTCPPAMLAAVVVDLPVIETPPIAVAMPAIGMPRSFNPAAVDPPPRTSNS